MSRLTWTKLSPATCSSASRIVALHPELVDRAHRPDAQAVLPDELALALVELTRADERDARPVDRRRRPGVALEPGAGQTERRREHHAVHVAASATSPAG